jgi:hypothetical protein
VGPRQCPNCAAEALGPYCHACGQKTIEPDALSLRSFVHDFAQEVVNLDFATVRSLRAVGRPGFLTREYLAGRRRPYLSPLKVYLLCAAIFFFAAPLAGLTFESLTERDRSGLLQKLASSRMQAKSMDRALFAERFDLRLQTVYTFGLSVSVLAAAVLLALLFRRQRRPLGAHVVFALHYVAFLYLAAILVGGIALWLRLEAAASIALAYVVIGPYLILSLRRVYEESIGRILAKAAVLAIATFLIDSIVNAAAVLLTLLIV